MYIDIDVDGDNRIAALMESEIVPIPTVPFCRHHRTNIRRYGASKASTSTSRRSTLKLLAIAFGGDSACTDRNRVLRVPGFRNCKYDPAHLVTVEYPERLHISSCGLPVG